MKLLTLLLLSFFLGGLIQAQESSDTFGNIDSSTLIFFSGEITPTSNTISSFNRSFKLHSTKKHSLFFYSGILLQGLKYKNALDQFSSTPFFDERNYEPSTASDYNSFLRSNYFTLNQTRSFVW